MRRNRFAAVAVAGLLAGCDGTIDGGFIIGDPDCPPERPDCPLRIAGDGETEISGDAQGTAFVNDLNGGETILTEAGAPAPAVLRLVTEDGDFVGLIVEAGDASIVFDVGDGDVVATQDSALAFASADLERVAVFELPSQRFAYQTFGIWHSGAVSGGGTIGAGSFGIKTAGGDVPRSGAATYDGIAIGYAEIDGDVFLTDARVLATTSDFQQIDFGTSDTHVSFLDGTGRAAEQELNIVGTLTVTGNGFSGPASTNATGIDSGTVSGHFFGPDGAEIGGTFDLDGNGTAYTGAFGARR